MNRTRTLAILSKDLRDALRDGRVLVLLLLPIGFAIWFNATAPDDEAPKVEVAIVDPDGTGIGEELRRTATGSVDVRTRAVGDAEAARLLVATDEVGLAIITSAPTDTGPARARLLMAEDATPTVQGVAAIAPDAVARASGRQPAAAVRVETVEVTEQSPFRALGARTFSVVFALLLLAAFVAVMIVPMMVGEEVEKGTFGALRLAATGPEILLAKALSGLIFAAAGIGITVGVTDLELHDPAQFAGAAFALVVSLIGFGLLIGLLVGNANTINTYGGVLLMPVSAAIVAVFFVEDGVVATVLDVLPFTQAARLLADGVAAPVPFGAGATAWAVVAAWAVLGYILLVRLVTRREV